MNGNGVSYNNNNSGSYDNDGADAVEVHVEGGLTLKSFKVHEEDEIRQEEAEEDVEVSVQENV